MKNFRDTIIVGAGPVGLYLASLFEKANKSYLLLEASDHVGGQLINLYPEKDIVDLPGIECIKAKDYIALLCKKVNFNNVKLNQNVLSIEDNGNEVIVKTKNEEYVSKHVVISVGLGFSKPRPLGVNNEEETDNILYSLKDFGFLKNKRVAIFGGGDSALDWAKAISELTDDAHLIHRRLEFRGNADTIKNSKNLHVHLPYVPKEIDFKNGHANSVTISKVIQEGEQTEEITIPVDYILVNYGNVPTNTPFNLEYDGNFLKVDENLRSKGNIFVIGDAASYENKKRRIAPGNKEADKLFELLSI